MLFGILGMDGLHADCVVCPDRYVQATYDPPLAQNAVVLVTPATPVRYNDIKITRLSSRGRGPGRRGARQTGQVSCEAPDDDAANNQARGGFGHKRCRIAVARVHRAIRRRLWENAILGNFDPSRPDQDFQREAPASAARDKPAFYRMTVPLVAAGFALGALQTSIEFVKRIMAGSALRHQRSRQQGKPGSQAPGQ
jgi:hypothetical protein